MRTAIVKLVAIVALLTGILSALPVAAAGPVTSSVTVTVPGYGHNGQPWVDTGIVLTPGITATVTATGQACVDPTSPAFCGGPNGTGGGPSDILLPSASWGSLIGRVNGGAPIPVGVGPTTITGSGPLQFAQNDSLGNGNNTGTFQVTITFTLTSADACKDGGWQNFAGLFKNQGDCVSFIATGGKNRPSGA
jgi:hypothetical protein